MSLVTTLDNLYKTAKDKVRFVKEGREHMHSLSPFREQPIDLVKWVAVADVQANEYNPNSVASTELQLLYVSILKDGFTQPIVAIYDEKIEKYVIVDGFHRYFVLLNHPDIYERTQGMVPIVELHKDINDRMASTVRHNRARGKHSVQGMSSMVFDMLENGWDDVAICNELGMEPEELLRLKHITGFSKLFEDVEYNRAWMAKKQIALKHQFLKTGSNGLELIPPTKCYENGDVRVSFSIMGTGKRMPGIRYLQGMIPGIGASIDHRDQTGAKHVEIWSVAKAAWENIHPDATHHIVIQDDVVLCADFPEAMAYLVTLFPDLPISPCTFKKNVLDAKEAGKHWTAVNYKGIYGQGAVWPIALLEEALSWIEENIPLIYQWDDARFNYFLKAIDGTVMTTSPSLLQHDIDKEKSLLGHSKNLRRSQYFIGAEGKALDINWEMGRYDPIKDRVTIPDLEIDLATLEGI